MAVVSKKTAKSKTGMGKSSKRSAAARPEVEIPVLFRLPDLTQLPEPLSPFEIAPLQFTPSPDLSVGDSKINSAPAPAPTAATLAANEPAPAPKLTGRAWLALKELAVPLGRKTPQLVRRLSGLPYVGPVGVLAASLIVTLGLIYAPWDRNSKSPELNADAKAKSSSAEIVKPAPAVASATPPTEPKSDLQLKKIADQLNEQLSESESTDVNIATATASAMPADEHGEDAGEFTEPWWRRKPAGDHSLAKEEVVANEEHEVVVHGEEDEAGTGADDAQDGMNLQHPDLVDRRERNPRYESAEDRYPTNARSSSNRDSRTESAKRTIESEEKYASDAESTEEQAEEEIPQNPWRRIRKERLERETPREESIAQRPVRPRSTPSNSPKPQYRSPPDQDIDLESELRPDATTNGRGEPKRNGGK